MSLALYPSRVRSSELLGGIRLEVRCLRETVHGVRHVTNKAKYYEGRRHKEVLELGAQCLFELWQADGTYQQGNECRQVDQKDET